MLNRTDLDHRRLALKYYKSGNSEINLNPISPVGIATMENAINAFNQINNKIDDDYYSLMKCYYDMGNVFFSQSQCGLAKISLPSSNINCEIILPSTWNAAYVQRNDTLFYINKANQDCIARKVAEDILKRVDELLKPADAPRLLSEDELIELAAIIGHTHQNKYPEAAKCYHIAIEDHYKNIQKPNDNHHRFLVKAYTNLCDAYLHLKNVKAAHTAFLQSMHAFTNISEKSKTVAEKKLGDVFRNPERFRAHCEEVTSDPSYFTSEAYLKQSELLYQTHETNQLNAITENLREIRFRKDKNSANPPKNEIIAMIATFDKFKLQPDKNRFFSQTTQPLLPVSDVKTYKRKRDDDVQDKDEIPPSVRPVYRGTNPFH